MKPDITTVQTDSSVTADEIVVTSNTHSPAVRTSTNSALGHTPKSGGDGTQHLEAETDRRNGTRNRAARVRSAVLTQQVTEDLFAATKPNRNQKTKVRLNVKTEFAWDADYLFFTVREPFPTRNTGASLVFGRVTSETPLLLQSQMAENGVIFSDGIEKDFLEFNSGTQATIDIAERKGVLVE
jgi:hypothetical protein